jgi:PAS domain S-box-containing protein
VELFGYSPDEVLGRPASMFISEADPQAATVAHLRTAEEAGHTSFDAFWIRKDGTVGITICSNIELMSLYRDAFLCPCGCDLSAKRIKLLTERFCGGTA